MARADRYGLAEQNTVSKAAQFVVFYATALAMVLFDRFSGQMYFYDNDDRVRALQIKQWLDGQSYFDLGYPFVSMPEGYVSHYSRLVDIPYFLLTRLLAPIAGDAQAFEWATLVWPILLLVAFCWLAVEIMRRIFAGQVPLAALVVTAILMRMAVLNFTPGRIDHHNLQLVLVLGFVAALLPMTRGAAVLAGLIAAVSIAVGLETVPYLVAGFTGLALLASLRPDDGSGPALSFSGLGLLIGMAPAAFLSLGADGVATIQCDVVGMPVTMLMMGAGAILALAPMLWSRMQFSGTGAGRVSCRLASLAIPGVVLAGFFVLLFPECLGGHYGQLGPLTKSLWLDRLAQEQSVSAVIGERPLSAGLHIAEFLILAIAGGFHAVVEWKNGRAGPAVLVMIAIAALLVFMILFRSISFPAALFPILLPAVLIMMQRAMAGGPIIGVISARAAVAAAAIVPAVLVSVLLLMAPTLAERRFELDVLSVDECKKQDLHVLESVTPGRILAGHNLSLRIAEEFPQHTVAALPLHRAGAGTERLLKAFTSPDGEQRAEALRPFDYLALCAREKFISELSKLPLAADLLTGRGVTGLTEITSGSPFRLYRVDATKLQ